MHAVAPASATKQRLSKRLIIGFVTLASAAIIGTVGMASAHNKPMGHNHQAPVGYGNVETNVETNIGIEVNGDNNIVQVVINYFFN